MAKETSLITSGYEAIILGKIDFDDHILLTKKRKFEPSIFFCDQPNVLSFNNVSELQAESIPARIFYPAEYRMIYRGSTLAIFTIQQDNR